MYQTDKFNQTSGEHLIDNAEAPNRVVISYKLWKDFGFLKVRNDTTDEIEYFYGSHSNNGLERILLTIIVFGSIMPSNWYEELSPLFYHLENSELLTFSEEEIRELVKSNYE